MNSTWEEALSCAVACTRCDRPLRKEDRRILSVLDHRPICMGCKKAEEARPDYEEVSRKAVGQCLADTEQMYGDPGGYCFHHFYPYTCS